MLYCSSKEILRVWLSNYELRVPGTLGSTFWNWQLIRDTILFKSGVFPIHYRDDTLVLAGRFIAFITSNLEGCLGTTTSRAWRVCPLCRRRS